MPGSISIKAPYSVRLYVPLPDRRYLGLDRARRGREGGGGTVNARSGMTLVEVLAALTLLTLIAAATLPVLHAAIGNLRARPAGEELSDLCELVHRNAY